MGGTLNVCCLICGTALWRCVAIIFPNEETEARGSEAISLSSPSKWRVQIEDEVDSTSTGSFYHPHAVPHPHWHWLLNGFSKTGMSHSCEYWHVYSVLGPIYSLALLRPREKWGRCLACGIWISLDTVTQQIILAPESWGLCRDGHVQRPSAMTSGLCPKRLQIYSCISVSSSLEFKCSL